MPNSSSKTDKPHPQSSSAVTATSSKTSVITETSSVSSAPPSSTSSVSTVTSTPAPPSAPTGNATYYFYEQLTAEQQRLYGIINTAVRDMTVGMIELGATTNKDISLAYKAVRNDHPEYFWMPYAYMKRESTIDSVTTWSIAMEDKGSGSSVSYLCSKDERTVMEASLNKKVSEICALVPSGISDYEAELIFHDWICDNVIYSENEAQGNQIYTAYGALVNGIALCEGYSRAMQLLCSYKSIPCTLVCGTNAKDNQPHMWNLIKINNSWYHLDVTWDDVHVEGYEKGSITLHTYFNLNDTSINKTHALDRDIAYVSNDEFNLNADPNYNISLPKCTATQKNYIQGENITLPDITDDPATTLAAQKVIVSCLNRAISNERSYCEFYLGYDPNGVDAPKIAEKYPLQNAINDVNSNSKIKIKSDLKTVSSGLSGKTFIIFFEYEGE